MFSQRVRNPGCPILNARRVRHLVELALYASSNDFNDILYSSNYKKAVRECTESFLKSMRGTLVVFNIAL